MKPKITLIVAAAENDVIGLGGQLPWRISSDLRLFRRLTIGKPIIMGRKTFQSIGKPLDGRDNIIVTRDAQFATQGTIAVASLQAALDQGRTCAEARGVDEVMVIGGAEIFRNTIPLADRIYLTRVHGTPDGDTMLPPIDENEWREVSREPLPRTASDEFACTLIVLERERSGNRVAISPA